MATSGAHTKRERNKHTHPHTHTWLLLAVVRQLSHKSPTPAKRPEPKRDCSGMPTSGASPCCTLSARALLHLQHDSETHRRDPDPTSGLRHTQHKEIHTHAGRGREGRRVKLRRCTCAKKTKSYRHTWFQLGTWTQLSHKFPTPGRGTSGGMEPWSRKASAHCQLTTLPIQPIEATHRRCLRPPAHKEARAVAGRE